MFLQMLIIGICISNVAATSVPKQILSFGGNGMIGSAVMARLIEMDLYNITIVTRGKWHYGTHFHLHTYFRILSFNAPQFDEKNLDQLPFPLENLLL